MKQLVEINPHYSLLISDSESAEQCYAATPVSQDYEGEQIRHLIITGNMFPQQIYKDLVRRMDLCHDYLVDYTLMTTGTIYIVTSYSYFIYIGGEMTCGSRVGGWTDSLYPARDADMIECLRQVQKRAFPLSQNPVKTERVLKGLTDADGKGVELTYSVYAHYTELTPPVLKESDVLDAFWKQVAGDSAPNYLEALQGLDYHSDKAEQYQSTWRTFGLEPEIARAVYLLTYSREMSEEKPKSCDWVIDNYRRYEPLYRAAARQVYDKSNLIFGSTAYPKV